MVRIPEKDSDGETFEVEKIVAKRKRQGRIEFLVKWRGYNSDENSWEPKANLAGCADAIRKFNRHEKEMQKSFSKSRQSRVSGKVEKRNSTNVFSPSSKDDLDKYRIFHQIAAPPISSYLEKRTRHLEMKPAREEKAPKKDSIVVTYKKKSVLTILVAITLFFFVILAFVQPVGFRSNAPAATI